jgi:purine-binding chemotaxis protein CheW
MFSNTYLICHLADYCCALPSDAVREIFPLPELQTLPDSPGDLLGTLDFRGQLLPVMHVGQRVSKAQPICHLTDTVVVVTVAGKSMGLLFTEVSEVYPIAPEEIDRDLGFGRQGFINPAFLSGVTQHQGQPLLLLEPQALVALPDGMADLSSSDQDLAPAAPPLGVGDFYDRYFPQATPAQRQLLHQRAVELRSSLQNADAGQNLSLAVFDLGGEFFGLPLHWVREFIKTPKIQPVPTAPGAIVGNLNLRGEILTLLDLRATLNISQEGRSYDQAVVAQVGDLVTGIAIDTLHDIVELDPATISPLPVTSQASRGQFVQGTTIYGDRLLSLLDLPQLLAAA